MENQETKEDNEIYREIIREAAIQDQIGNYYRADMLYRKGLDIAENENNSERIRLFEHLIKLALNR